MGSMVRPFDMPAPTADEMEAIARDTVEALPEPFRDEARAVALVVADYLPDDMGGPDDDPWEITGLYDGLGVMHRHSGAQPTGPDTVWLFRLPILLEWAERGDVSLADLVAHVTVHEFAHHFGWSDEQIARIDRWWE